MAQAATEPQQQFPAFPAGPQYVMVPVAQSNGLGVFGFFLALIGLIIPTGIVALLGLLISLVALGRSPRGWAMMGTLVGLFGTVIWLVIDIAAVLVGLIAVIGIGLGLSAGFLMTQPEVVEITSDMLNTAIAVEHRYESDDEMPASLDGLGLSAAALVDPWGTSYRYELRDRDNTNSRDELRFELTSAGPDTAFGTDDDILLSKLDRLWENAFETFEDKMEELNSKVESLQRNGRYTYSHNDDSAARFSIGDSRAAIVVTPDAPAPPNAPASSYADTYERRAEQAIEGDIADEKTVDPQAVEEENPNHGPA